MATIDLPTAPVQTAIDFFATPIHSPIDAVTLAVQPFRQLVSAGCVGTPRLTIEIPVDAVSAAIVALFDTITLAIEAVFDTISRVGDRDTAAEQ